MHSSSFKPGCCTLSSCILFLTIRPHDQGMVSMLKGHSSHSTCDSRGQKITLRAPITLPSSYNFGALLASSYLPHLLLVPQLKQLYTLCLEIPTITLIQRSLSTQKKTLISLQISLLSGNLTVPLLQLHTKIFLHLSHLPVPRLHLT